MTPFKPTVHSEIFALRPDFLALNVVARGLRNGPSDAATLELLRCACLEPGRHAWGDAHLASWQDAYKAFGAKPARTPSSAEALRRRVSKDGGLNSANAIVDIYNAVSLRFAVPVGGENVDAYVGPPRLVRAAGGEPFDTVRNGEPHVEGVDAGEVVWRDDHGVTCRRWNWRQGVRTRIEERTTAVWFVFERLDPMPVSALNDAADELIEGLVRLSPDARFERFLSERSAF